MRCADSIVPPLIKLCSNSDKGARWGVARLWQLRCGGSAAPQPRVQHASHALRLARSRCWFPTLQRITYPACFCRSLGTSPAELTRSEPCLLMVTYHACRPAGSLRALQLAMPPSTTPASTRRWRLRWARWWCCCAMTKKRRVLMQQGRWATSCATAGTSAARSSR